MMSGRRRLTFFGGFVGALVGASIDINNNLPRHRLASSLSSFTLRTCARLRILFQWHSPQFIRGKLRRQKKEGALSKSSGFPNAADQNEAAATVSNPSCQ